MSIYQRFAVAGKLVEIPLPGKRNRPLDGFLVPGDRRRPLLIFVHGMHSNFYRSALKKAFMQECRRLRMGMLSFNNRGAESGTNDERFRDCLADLDAAIAFGKRQGYKSFVLAGHSTGCQKIVYYQALHKSAAVRAMVLLAIGDDMAIMKRDLKQRFDFWVRRACMLVRRGRASDPLEAPVIPPFSARRFLSIADPKEIEAGLFDLENGKLDYFRRVRCPVLVVIAGGDEYETMKPEDMVSLFRIRYRGSKLDTKIMQKADHGFHGIERRVTRIVLRWISGDAVE
jgi:pimeloyl-ACP methyl ester carboxylesterase